MGRNASVVLHLDQIPALGELQPRLAGVAVVDDLLPGNMTRMGAHVPVEVRGGGLQGAAVDQAELDAAALSRRSRRPLGSRTEEAAAGQGEADRQHARQTAKAAHDSDPLLVVSNRITELPGFVNAKV